MEDAENSIFLSASIKNELSNGKAIGVVIAGHYNVSVSCEDV